MLHIILFVFLVFSFFVKPSESSATAESPTCLSDRPPGCSDARVYRNNLNYDYQGIVLSGESKSINIDTADGWHAESQLLLRRDLASYKHVIGKSNIALAAIQIIYEEENELKVSVGYVNLPFIYFSGSVSNLVPQATGPSNNHIAMPDILEGHPTDYNIKTVGDFLSTEGPAPTPAQNIMAQLKPLLANYFNAEISPTKFTSDNIDQWHESIIDGNLSSISQSFFHSEQAFLLQLRGEPTILNPALDSIPPGAIIHQITLQIVSSRQMCRCCSKTYFRVAEGAGDMKQNLKLYIETYLDKHFLTAQDQVRIFVECSGLFPFEPPAGAYRARHSGKLNLNINSHSFSPHVAHENIGKTSQEIVVR